MEMSPSAPTRRTAIARAVIELAAEGGARAITHSAVDRRLDLPKGSTSYYCRTRTELLEAGSRLMRSNSQTAFTDFLGTQASSPTETTADTITEVTRDYLMHLTSTRSTEIRARLALFAELDSTSLRGLFFSFDAMIEYFESTDNPDPRSATIGFIDLLEGVLLRTALEPERPLAATEITKIVDNYLRGAAGRFIAHRP